MSQPEGLTPQQARKFGNAAVANVIAEIDSHGFFDEFSQSIAFGYVLNWLKRLRADAAFQGFQGIIREYGLDQPTTPVAELTRQLRELTTETEEMRKDPFRVYAASAARAVLMDAITRKIESKPEDTPAVILGKQLASITAHDIVVKYVRGFVYEFLSSVLSRADPDLTKRVNQEALRSSQRTVEQVAKRAVRTVVTEGRLNDTPRIHEIVLDELRQLIGPS